MLSLWIVNYKFLAISLFLCVVVLFIFVWPGPSHFSFIQHFIYTSCGDFSFCLFWIFEITLWLTANLFLSIVGTLGSNCVIHHLLKLDNCVNWFSIPPLNFQGKKSNNFTRSKYEWHKTALVYRKLVYFVSFESNDIQMFKICISLGCKHGQILKLSLITQNKMFYALGDLKIGLALQLHTRQFWCTL